MNREFFNKSSIGLGFLIMLAGCGGGDPYKTTPTSLTASSASTLNGQAQKLINTKCGSCHGKTSLGQGGFSSASDIGLMINQGKIIPGSPETSRVYIRVAGGTMPPSAPLPDKEKMLIATWIYNLYIDPNSAFGKVFNGLFQPKCLGCHGATKASGGVSFETYYDTMKVVSAGKPEFSLVYQAVLSGRMPKGKAPLSTAELQLLSTWIAAGALR